MACVASLGGCKPLVTRTRLGSVGAVARSGPGRGAIAPRRHASVPLPPATSSPSLLGLRERCKSRSGCLSGDGSNALTSGGNGGGGWGSPWAEPWADRQRPRATVRAGAAAAADSAGGSGGSGLESGSTSGGKHAAIMFLVLAMLGGAGWAVSQNTAVGQAAMAALAKSGFTAAFALIFVSELGDKTFFIAALLAMRLGRLTVLAGATSALCLMSVVSVAIGKVFQQIPTTVTSSMPIG